jgi:hypothetical protein
MVVRGYALVLDASTNSKQCQALNSFIVILTTAHGILDRVQIPSAHCHTSQSDVMQRIGTVKESFSGQTHLCTSGLYSAYLGAYFLFSPAIDTLLLEAKLEAIEGPRVRRSTNTAGTCVTAPLLGPSLIGKFPAFLAVKLRSQVQVKACSSAL